MSQLIISSREKAAEAFRRHSPGAVISLLEPGEDAPPCFCDLASERHLVINDDCDRAPDQSGCAKDRVAKIIAFALAHEDRAPLLIHCHRGVARSMATAFIVLCALNKDRDECRIAQALLKAAPYADPNLLLISEADELLHRDDRMIEAVLDADFRAGAAERAVACLPLHL